MSAITSSPQDIERRELAGGVIVVGRSSLKEYLQGLKRGWGGGVDIWDWEKEIEGKLEYDGVFEERVKTEVVPGTSSLEPISTATSKTNLSGLNFLAKPQPIPYPPSSAPTQQTNTIPLHYHTPPDPLPSQPPILLVPFTNHLGFKQFPQMIYSFFTEHHRVRSGARAALALIEGPTRPFEESDLDFERDTEGYYPKWYKDTPERTSQARKEYYEKLSPRLEAARSFASGARAMTKEEETAQKVTTELDLREERKKREMRWMGTEDGYEIVKPDSEVAWDDKWRGWLRVYDVDGSNQDSSI
jgi:import inner membrane translocase subunit TIM54